MLAMVVVLNVSAVMLEFPAMSGDSGEGGRCVENGCGTAEGCNEGVEDVCQMEGLVSLF